MFGLAKLIDSWGGRVKPSLLIAGAILTASIPFQSAQAASFKTTFTPVFGESLSSSGTASFTVDGGALSAAIGPNGFGDIVSLVTAFTAKFTGLSTSPTTTTFGLADLTSLFVETDANSSVIDAAYFAGPNAAAYRASTPFLGAQILNSSTGSTIYFSDTTAVPEPSTTLSLLALGTLGTGVILKRKLKKSYADGGDTEVVVAEKPSCLGFCPCSFNEAAYSFCPGWKPQCLALRPFLGSGVIETP